MKQVTAAIVLTALLSFGGGFGIARRHYKASPPPIIKHIGPGEFAGCFPGDDSLCLLKRPKPNQSMFIVRFSTPGLAVGLPFSDITYIDKFDKDHWEKDIVEILPPQEAK